MRALDLHPEDLIDKLVTGELSDAETDRLRAHVAVCSVCRLEISLRDDLGAQLQEPFGARPPLHAPEQEHAPLPPASRRPRAPLRRSVTLLAVAAILGTGGALAAVLTGVVHTPWGTPAPAVLDELAPAITPHAPQTKRTAPVPRSRPANVPAESVQLLEEPASEAPSGASARHPVAVEKPRASVVDRPASVLPRSTKAAGVQNMADARRASGDAAKYPAGYDAAKYPEGHTATARSFPELRTQEPAASSGNARPESPVASSAASLFAAANRARRDGNVASAVALYRTLERQYPSSAESQLSRAVLAKLELDNGDAEAAVAGFDRYLSEGAPVLTAESLVGRARALEQLGKLEEAAASWRTVIRRFPGSVHARLASTRLSALGMR